MLDWSSIEDQTKSLIPQLNVVSCAKTDAGGCICLHVGSADR
jgi:hypothetical protein